MPTKFKVAMLVSSLALIGCTKMTPAQMALQSANMGLYARTSNRPVCEINPAEYTLDTKLIAFELTTSAGLRAGFDAITGFVSLLNINFKAASGRMLIGMSIYDAISPKYELVSVMGSGRSLDFGASVNLGFQQIGAGFNVANKTPLTSLIESSLTDTFDNLYAQVSQSQQDWHTQVAAVPSKSEVIIAIGSFGGVRVGDQFTIYNVNHVWAGKPCASDHLIARKTTEAPLAIGTVTQVANNAALLSVQMSDATGPNTFIDQGARVEIAKLVGKDRQLSRLLQIRDVGGAQIAYDNAMKVDVSSPLRDHVKAIARNYGFLVLAQ